MNPRPIGVAVIGVGIMGRRMLAALRPHARFRIAVLWDPDATALRAVAGETPGARVARSLDDAVHDAGVDLVYIASPPATHRPIVAAALAAAKACLCEKPLAADLDEAQALRELVVDAGLPFAINFPFAGSPAARGLIDLVRDGRLGTIHGATVTARFAQWPRPWQVGASGWLAGAAEGGFAREVLSHFVFLAHRLFGAATVDDVQLTRPSGACETALRARLVHAQVTVNIDAAVAGDVADTNRFEIVGSAGTAALVDWGRLAFDGTLTERIDATPGTLDRVARMLDGHADNDLATVGEGVAVVRCIETMLRR